MPLGSRASRVGCSHRRGSGATLAHQQNFPPLDTLAGRQASLLYLGYPSQDLPGIWGVSSQVALVRYQIDAELPGLGESSPETAVALDGEAQGRMCMNREDPSTVFL